MNERIFRSQLSHAVSPVDQSISNTKSERLPANIQPKKGEGFTGTIVHKLCPPGDFDPMAFAKGNGAMAQSYKSKKLKVLI